MLKANSISDSCISALEKNFQERSEEQFLAAQALEQEENDRNRGFVFKLITLLFAGSVVVFALASLT